MVINNGGIMKNNKIKFSLLVCLFLIELLSLFLTYKSFLNIEIQEVKETYEVDKKHFSMFISDGNDNYTEYTESNLFPKGYKLNMTKSGCIDTKGNIIEGILSGLGNNVTVTSNKTTYCYLYYDKQTDTEKMIENVSSDVLWNSTLESDGYRYVGTNPDNYICFGYSDASTDCDFTNSTNTDLYAYRIIGIFEDSSGDQHLKLIKKEALNLTYAWHSENDEVDWQESDLYKGLNDSYFLTNTTFSYMQNSTWLNKIENWNYIATNTKTYESSGPNYTEETIKEIYLHEMNLNSKNSLIGDWQIITSKIGLMYVSDYAISIGSDYLEQKINENFSHFSLSWMHLSRNDLYPPRSYEWTMSRYGSTTWFASWYVCDDGYVYPYAVYDGQSVRPVFYLTSDVSITGEGTIDNPYIIS